MADVIELGEFPIRPRRLSGESLAGYIYRYVGANGHLLPDQLRRILRDIYRPAEPSCCDEAWQRLLAMSDGLLGIDREIWRLNHAAAAPGQGRLASCDEFDYLNLRLCPRCLGQDAYHRAAWELPLAQSCLEHQCMLISKCGCGRKLSWGSLQIDWMCHCGQDIRTLRCDASARYCRHLDGFIINGYRAYQHAGLTNSAAPPPLSLAPYSTISSLSALVRLLPHKRGSAGITRLRAHVIVGRLLNRWPMLLQRSLARVERGLAQAHSELCIELTPTVGFKDLRDWYQQVAANESVNPELRQVVQRLWSATLVSTQQNNEVIFNPAFEGQERQRRLRAFALWWQRLFDSYEPMDPQIARLLVRRAGSNRPVERYSQSSRPHWSLINRLLGAASSDLPIAPFRPLAWEWPERYHTPVDDPLRLLLKVSEQLAGTTYALARRLDLLCDRALAAATS